MLDEGDGPDGSTAPNAARLYDYLLGGGHNFAVDRDLAHQLMSARADIVNLARSNRAFLQRAVQFCLAAGIDQFLDLGSGVPTVGNVHQVAHASNPEARVAYVDFEPVAVAASTELLADVDNATITAADLRDPTAVLEAPAVAGLLDFDRPVALLAVAALHYVSDDDRPTEVVAGYCAAMAPGSLIAITHAITDPAEDLLVAASDTVGLMSHSATPTRPRPVSEVAALLAGFDLVAPGLVEVNAWRPTIGPTGTGHTDLVAAVGRL